jgi:hypothetical protein
MSHGAAVPFPAIRLRWLTESEVPRLPDIPQIDVRGRDAIAEAFAR